MDVLQILSECRCSNTFDRDRAIHLVIPSGFMLPLVKMRKMLFGGLSVQAHCSGAAWRPCTGRPAPDVEIKGLF